MALLFFYQWIPEPVIKALCWTFVHSIWQGVVAALVSALIIAGTRKSKASTRYNLLVLVFTLFITVSIATFFYQLTYFDKQNETDALVQVSPPIMGTNMSMYPGTSSTDDSLLGTGLSEYLDKQAPIVVLLWSLFFLANCIRFSSGLFYIRSLRRSAVFPVGNEWTVLVERLSSRLSISKKVVLKESSKIKVPLALGYLKATIIVPIGLLSNLPADQVETVLLHELAHIRRKDYLVNLLQTCAETVFFFNPAMLWISSLIRREREACCDDIVLSHTTEKRSYLEALVSFQEYSLQSGQLLALTQKKNHLLHRVQRMLQGENQKLNSMEKTVLVLGIIGITAFGFITKKDSPVYAVEEFPAQNEFTFVKPKEVVKPAGTLVLPKPQKKVSMARAVKDTVPAKQQQEIKNQQEFSSARSSTNDDGQTKTYEAEVVSNDGKKYRVKKVNGTVTEFTINGEKADPALNENAQIIERMESRDAERAERAKRNAEQRKKERQLRKEELEEKKTEMATRQKERVQEQKERREQHEKHLSEMKMKYTEQKKLHQEHKVKRESQEKLSMLKKMEYADASKKIRLANNGEVSSIITDLKKNNLIADDNSFSFSLNNKELVVNGAKQPAELHQSLKQKYIQNDGDVFIYSRKGSSTSMTINKE